MTQTLQSQIATLHADGQGKGYRQIARELGISPHAARKEIEAIKAREAAKLPSTAAELIVPDPPKNAPASTWAVLINAAWRKSHESIFEAGRLLIAAKESLPHGEWVAMCESGLLFQPRTAQRIMAIASDARLANTTHASHLPQSWTTLYELTRLDDDQFQTGIDEGLIRPDMERKDITTVAKRERRERRERQLGAEILALPQQKFGIILADPEWRFEPYSRESGMNRAADNHYPTSATDIIAARDVPSIAADDCALFLWATAPMLPDALTVMEAWGFTYKTHLIWNKIRPGKGRGAGYWVTGEHELVLIGTKGRFVAPATAMCGSVFSAAVGPHSAKPETIAALIEREWPSVPKIELNRRGPARDGWSAWGNETQQTEAAE